VKLLVENEVPGDLDNSVSMKANILIPAKATEMMNYLPNKLSTNFKQLWKYHSTRSLLPKKKTKSTKLSMDRVTHSMTSKQHVVALAAIGIKMKVNEALKSTYANEWNQAINLKSVL